MDNSVTSEMIQRFLNYQSDEAEADLVSEYLRNNPHILKQYSGDADEWQQAADQYLSGDLRSEMWGKVAREMNVGKRLGLRLLAAASIIGMLIGGYFFFRQTTRVEQSGSSSATAIQSKKVIENNTTIEKKANLPDGSRLILEPGTVVYYYDVFNHHRNVYLRGEAYFEVAHDKEHPFTVYADSIGTTALGTHFWVKSGNQRLLTVRLLEGKVVVRSYEKKFPMRDIVLSPGQKVVVNKLTGLVSVSSIRENRKKDSLNMVNHSKVESKTVWTNSAYRFSKASLIKVFGRIESQYHVQIIVSDSVIADYQFTGKIMYNDSLNTILDAICRMNNLSYKRDGNNISIEKK